MTQTPRTHRHTGLAFGYTVSGAWKYREYVNRAGCFLYEPANSVHTLTVLENAEIWSTSPAPPRGRGRVRR